jgi:hypothetical protein
MFVDGPRIASRCAMINRYPDEPMDPGVSEHAEEGEESPVTDATPVDDSATIVNSSDSPMNVAGELELRHADDREGGPEDA